MSTKRTKLSVTIPPSTVALLDGAVAAGRFKSRSAALAGAIAGWVESERCRLRDEEIDAYYDGVTAAEADEERAWSELARQALVRDAGAPYGHESARSGAACVKGSRRRTTRARTR